MNPWRDLKGLPKELWLLSATVLINRAGTMVLPFLMIYLTKALNIPAQKASLALIAHGIGGILTAPLAGRIADNIGASKVMKTSLVLSGLTLFLFPFINSFPAIVALTFIWSIISEAFRPACMAIISEIVPSSQLKQAFALNRLAINLGMSVGPAVGGFLVYFSYPLLFVVDGVTSLLAGIILILFFKQVKKAFTVKSESGTKLENIDNPLPPAKNRAFIYFLLALGPTTLVFFQLESTAPLYLVRDLKMSEAIYGLLFTLNTVIITFLEIPINSITNTWAYKYSLALGCVLIGLGFGAMIWIHDPLTAAISVVIWTFGEMILFPASSAYVAEVSPVSKRGEYMGIFAMSFGFGTTLGPVFGTNVLENFGASTLWLSCLFFGFLSAIMMLKIKQKA
jgi:MFS family permease